MVVRTSQYDHRNLRVLHSHQTYITGTRYCLFIDTTRRNNKPVWLVHAKRYVEDDHGCEFSLSYFGADFSYDESTELLGFSLDNKAADVVSASDREELKRRLLQFEFFNTDFWKASFRNRRRLLDLQLRVAEQLGQVCTLDAKLESN